MLDTVCLHRVYESFPAARGKTDPEGCMSIDSWEVDIIGSKSSSAAVSVADWASDKMDPEGCMSIDSWEVDIIGSKLSSAAVSVADCQEASKKDVNNTHSSNLKLSRQLETKLEMLRKNASIPDHQSVNEDEKSMLSSRISVVSIQPSVETACVRQNADIATMMEDTMMDFMVMDCIGV